MAENAAPAGFRERHHRLIWAALWPVRKWFTHFPIHRGKGVLIRYVIEPLLPPKPAKFSYTLPHGETIQLLYREDLGRQVLFTGGYEDREIAELCKHITAGGTVFDVGANIGLSALEFARSAGPQGRVFAFEPHPDTAERLRGNLAQNAITSATIIQAAVGAKAGQVTFHESAHPTLSSASVIPPDLVRSFDVPVTTVDIAWAEAGKPVVCALKVDVEGGELEVLQGASELLQRDHPAVLLEAWGAQQLEPIHALLVAAGYTQHQPTGFEPRNYLYLVAA